DVTVEQMKAVVASLREMLARHEEVRREDIYVRIAGFGEQSIDIDVAAPIETTDANEFAAVRERILLEAVALLDAEGAQPAVPRRPLAQAPPRAPAPAGAKT